MSSITKLVSTIAVVRAILLRLRLWWRLLRDPRVPEHLKLVLPALAAVYVLWPVDLLTDLMPLIGQLDDAAVFLVAMKLFESFAPPRVVAEHLARLRRRPAPPAAPDDGDVIDADYRVL